MNVYVYGGRSREEAKVSLVSGNKQPDIDTIYDITYESGILVIAYPDLQADIDVELPTNLEFEYWVEAVESGDNDNVIID